MKRALLMIAILLIVSITSVLAQERIDVIYLKNGDVLKGIIVENVPNVHVRIELQGGSVLTVKYADIAKFTKENPAKPAPQAQPAPQLQPPPGDALVQPDMQKMMAYEQEKKSSGTAIVLSLVVSSAGHAYAGNWPRGLLFTAGRVAGVVLALTAGTSTNYVYSPGYYWASYGYYTSETTTWFYVGIGAAVGFAVWEAIDAGGEADRYNEKLYEKTMGKKPVAVSIISGANGPQFQLSYHL